MKDKIIKEVWDIVYGVFEKDDAQGVLPVFATKATINELQFRMMHHVAALRAADQSHVSECADAVMGDALAANAAGWMTDEACSRIADLLDQLRR